MEFALKARHAKIDTTLEELKKLKTRDGKDHALQNPVGGRGYFAAAARCNGFRRAFRGVVATDYAAFSALVSRVLCRPTFWCG